MSDSAEEIVDNAIIDGVLTWLCLPNDQQHRDLVLAQCRKANWRFYASVKLTAQVLGVDTARKGVI